jgi:hypothetical protein
VKKKMNVAFLKQQQQQFQRQQQTQQQQQTSFQQQQKQDEPHPQHEDLYDDVRTYTKEEFEALLDNVRGNQAQSLFQEYVTQNQQHENTRGGRTYQHR